MFKSTLFALAILSLAGQVEAQAMYRLLEGTQAGGSFGKSVCALGDLDGDGIEDFAVGAPATTGAGTAMVHVYSGHYLQLLFTITAPLGSSPGFGTFVLSAGDWDGDGTPDIAIMTDSPISGTQYGELRIASGVDGSILKTISSASNSASWGASVTAVGDHDGDGRVDFLVGAPTDDTVGVNFGAAYLISSFTGVNLRSHYGPSYESTFGKRVANVGDLDTDGIDDYAIHDGGYGGFSVYSGATGNFIRQFVAGSLSNLAGIGDINNDGIGDLIASNVQPGPFTNPTYVFSGSDGSILNTILSNAVSSSVLGLLLGPAGDLDNDGTPDYYVYDGYYPEKAIHIFSGATHQVLEDLAKPNWRSTPHSCARLGDLNGDGYDDYVLGDPSVDADKGVVRLNYSRTENFEAYHSANSAPTESLVLSWQGGYYVGALVATGATPGALGLAAASFAPGDFIAFGLPILLSFDVPNLATTGTIGATFAGEFRVGNLDRRHPILAGFPIYIQFYEVSPIPRASNGLRIVYVEVPLISF